MGRRDRRAGPRTRSRAGSLPGWTTTGPGGGPGPTRTTPTRRTTRATGRRTDGARIDGDGTGYRVDANTAGVDVHQMFLNTQFETNGGNGWLRVVEFMKDGQTVKVSYDQKKGELTFTTA